MSDSTFEELIRRALEIQAAGETLDLETVCAAHMDLLPAVASSLALDSDIRSTLGRDPLLFTTLNDRYKLISWLGAGAMGVVYAASDLSLGREVAIKVLQQGVFATEARRMRFLREARVLAALQHEHVVKVYDQGVSQTGLHYIVMDRVDGESLALHLRAESTAEGTPSFDWIPRAVTWCAQIASAMAEAHREKILHRDIKPSNILIDSTGKAILVDFGIAARVGEEALTTGGSTLGTPCYMSPEQAVDSSDVTGKVDIYGLAATLYHLVTFKPPFDGSYHTVILKLRNSDPTPPSKVQHGLPRDLCAIIEKGMHRDSRQRYATMEAFERDLRSFLVHRPVVARPVTWAGRQWRWIKRNRRAAVLVCLVVLALVVGMKQSADWQTARIQSAQNLITEYEALDKALAPSAAFEGTLKSRDGLPRDERAQTLADLRRMVALRPTNRFAHMTLVELLLDQGETQESFLELQKMVSSESGSDPASPYLKGLLVAFENADSTVSGALAIADAALPAPSTPFGAFVAGLRATRKKDYLAAWKFVQMSELLPESQELGLNVQLTLAERTRKTAAGRLRVEWVESCARRIEARKGYATARTLYFRGSASLLREGEESSARDCLKQALELGESFGVLFNLARAYSKLRDYATAGSTLERALELRPDAGNARCQLCLAHARSGDFAEARRVISKLPPGARLSKSGAKSYYQGLVELLYAYDLDRVGRAGDAPPQPEAAVAAAELAFEYLSVAYRKKPEPHHRERSRDRADVCV